MPNASQLTPDNRFQALFVGESGSGKTPAAASFFNAGKVKIEDFDGRIRGLLGCPWIQMDKVDYDFYPTVRNGTKTFFDRFNEKMDVLQIESRDKKNPFKTHVLDSVTSLSWKLLKDGVSLTKGNMIGSQKMPGPSDFNFESVGTKDVIDFYKSLPDINFILTAHLIDKYGPVDPEDPYKGNQVVGSRISLRDKLAAELIGWFDNVLEFKSEMSGNTPKFYVRFWSDIARTVYKGMPYGWIDITNKDFYLTFQELLKNGVTKK